MSQATSATTLHLTGGLTAANGLTMDFTLYGTGPNDEIDTGNGLLTPSGTLTFNFTNVGGALSTSMPYILIYSAPGAPPFTIDPLSNIVINGPAGYTATLSGDVFGGRQVVDVSFSDVPEPTIYAMLGLGLAGLVSSHAASWPISGHTVRPAFPQMGSLLLGWTISSQ